MPDLEDSQMKVLIDQLNKNFITLSLNINKEKEERAIKDYEEYNKTFDMNINDMNPFSVYYIISKLSEENQVKFFRENINYIKEHDEEVFLYTLISPRSLSYYLSFNVLKELKNINISIFKKVISRNF